MSELFSLGLRGQWDQAEYPTLLSNRIDEIRGFTGRNCFPIAFASSGFPEGNFRSIYSIQKHDLTSLSRLVIPRRSFLDHFKDKIVLSAPQVMSLITEGFFVESGA